MGGSKTTKGGRWCESGRQGATTYFVERKHGKGEYLKRLRARKLKNCVEMDIAGTED